MLIIEVYATMPLLWYIVRIISFSQMCYVVLQVDDTGSIHRTTYNAFSIRKLSGSVQGHGTAQVY